MGTAISKSKRGLSKDLISIGFIHHSTYGKCIDNIIPIAAVNVADYN